MQTLTHDVLKLAPPGGIFDETVIGNLYPDASVGARRLLVHRASSKGEILRLKPGLFILDRPYRNNKYILDPFAIASLLHGPSHVSLQSALAWYGLIPEAVYETTSVTVARSRTFQTPVGIFSYTRVPANDPRAGVEAVKMTDESWAFIATPIRAIADLVYTYKEVTWKKDGMDWLTESLRIEREDIEKFSFRTLPAINRSIRDARTVAYIVGLRAEVKRGR